MEANTLFVVYRRHDGAEPGERVEGSVRSLGTAMQMLTGVWQIKSEQDGKGAFEEVCEVIEPADQLLVIDMTNQSFLSWPDTGSFPPPSS
jgi:hypothetical protein